MTGEEQQFEEIFGLLTKFSDYKVGDVITYRSSDTGRIKRGEIMWVELPGRTVSGKEHPLTYWVGFDAMYPSYQFAFKQIILFRAHVHLLPFKFVPLNASWYQTSSRTTTRARTSTSPLPVLPHYPRCRSGRVVSKQEATKVRTTHADVARPEHLYWHHGFSSAGHAWISPSSPTPTRTKKTVRIHHASVTLRTPKQFLRGKE